MPQNSADTLKTWLRYSYCRDNGHSKYIKKADLCERNFAGDQWDPADLLALAAVKRPALTINKIISTIGNVLGEQIYNRAETSLRPRSGSSPGTADAMGKVMRHISDRNQLAWKRSDMFADGVITSRGFLDVRLEMDKNAQGHVIYTKPNPKNIVLDPDGEEYDPDTWGDVFTTKWVTADDIAVLYSPEDAELLRNRGSNLPYSYDSIDEMRGRFGEQPSTYGMSDHDHSNVVRNIRVIERQFRMLDRQKHFLSPATGDTRPVPAEFERDRIAFYVEKYGFRVITKLVRRIRWFAMADNVVLHDDWSPYKHFTIIPYFPHFRNGNTIGLVENLLGSQELLNKTSSQELHIVNTTANSGWVVKAGTLTNMTVSELEDKGAQTGLVIEVNEMDGVEKITPNAVPTALDRISYKAEEHIKTISGVGDSQMGLDRADVAAKAIQAKQKAASTNLVKPLDNLTRSDFFLARATMALIQEFYSEERMITITSDQATGEYETVTINGVNQEVDTGEGPYEEITNDMTLGEYDIIITSVPARESAEDSQFDQAMAMREAGIQIPDSVLVDSSRLLNKKEIIKQMQGDQTSPEAIAQKELTMRGAAAEVAKVEAEAQQKGADAGLKVAKTGETRAKTQVIEQGEPDDGAGQAKMAEVQVKAGVAEHTAGLKEREMEQKMSLAEREHNLKRELAASDQQLKAQDLAQKRNDARVAAAQAAATAAQKPAPKSKI